MCSLQTKEDGKKVSSDRKFWTLIYLVGLLVSVQLTMNPPEWLYFMIFGVVVLCLILAFVYALDDFKEIK